MDRAQEARDLDCTLERMFKNIPSDPFIVSIPSNPQYHRPSDEKFKWREHTCFDLDEEHLQYATFRIHQPPESMVVLHSQNKPHNQTPATLTPSMPPKKKISLADYAKAKQNGTPFTGERAMRKDDFKLGDNVPQSTAETRRDERSRCTAFEETANGQAQAESDDHSEKQIRPAGLDIVGPNGKDIASLGRIDDSDSRRDSRKRDFNETQVDQDQHKETLEASSRAEKRRKVSHSPLPTISTGKRVDNVHEKSQTSSRSPRTTRDRELKDTSNPHDWPATLAPTSATKNSNKSLDQSNNQPSWLPHCQNGGLNGSSNNAVSSQMNRSSISLERPSCDPIASDGGAYHPPFSWIPPTSHRSSDESTLIHQHATPLASDSTSSSEILQRSTFSSQSSDTSQSSPEMFFDLPSKKSTQLATSTAGLGPSRHRPGVLAVEDGTRAEKIVRSKRSSKKSENSYNNSNTSMMITPTSIKKRGRPDDNVDASAPKRQRANTPTVFRNPLTPNRATSSSPANITPSSTASKKHLAPGVKSAVNGLHVSAASTPQGPGRTPNGEAQSTPGKLNNSRPFDMWKEENVRLEQLGRKLKKEFQSTLATMKSDENQMKSNNLAKLALIQGLESVICFMQAFTALDQSRPTIPSWRSLDGMIGMVVNRAQGHPHVLGILRLLQSTTYLTLVFNLGKTDPGTIQGATNRHEHLSRVQKYFNQAQHYSQESEQLVTRKLLSDVYPETYQESINLPLGASGHPMPVLRLATKFMGEWSKQEGVEWSQQLDEGLCSRL